MNAILFADLPPAGPNPIELGLMAVTCVLTVAAVVIAVRVMRKMNSEEPDSNPEVKP